MHRVYPLNRDFRLTVAPRADAIPPRVAARVEAIWATEKKARGDTLYNGTAYSLMAQTPAELTAFETDYQHLIAQRRAPELAAELKLRPLGVTGLLICRDGVVLGRRAPHVAADAGLWEPAPAGGLDRPDPAAQLLDELNEELGLVPSQVQALHAIGLVEDETSRVVDILYRLETGLDASELTAAHAAAASDEYQEIAVIARAQLPRFLSDHRADALPVLAAMLRLGGLLDG